MNCIKCKSQTCYQQVTSNVAVPICAQCILQDKEAEKQKKKDEMKKDCHCVRNLRRIFNDYAKPHAPLEEFDYAAVGHNCEDKSTTMTYRKNTVFICYRSVVTWYKGDHDSFVDYNVVVNGKTVKSYDERS